MRDRTARSGFTLVEILVIAPIVILVISSFIVFIINITGEVLKSRAALDGLGDTQSALNYIQGDIKLSTGFIDLISSPVSPQGPGDSGADWTNSGSLTTNQSFIVSRLATSSNPVSTSATTTSFVYTANTPNACGTNENRNVVYSYYSVYFLKTNPDNTKTLWQRNILPNYPASNLCSTPWQLPTCSAGQSASVCKAKDVEVAKNVDTFTVKYFDSSGTDVTDVRSAAASVEIAITTKKNVIGQEVATVNKLRVPKRSDSLDSNSVATDAYDMATPTFATSAPTTPVFSWDTIPTATNYQVEYRINSGSWVTASPNPTTPAWTYNGPEVFRNDTVTIKVTAKQGSNTTTYGTSQPAVATVPQWTDCQLQNDWQRYSSSWATAQFTKSSAGVVMMRGLIKYPGTSPVTPPSGTIICNLPLGFRPDGGDIIFFTATAAATAGRVNVSPNGNVTYWSIGRGEWQSLSSVIFATGSTGWQTATAYSGNNWVDFGSGYSPVKYKPDGLGRIHVQGLAKSGTINAYGYTLGTSSNGQNAYDIFPSYNCNSTGSLQYESTARIYARISANGCWSVQAMFYPTSYVGVNGWQSASLASPWVNNGTYNNAGYIKSSDGIVSLRGLIKTGTSGTIFTLPSGYRPSKSIICYATSSGEAYARIDVYTTGVVSAQESSGTNSTWLSIAGCNFMAEQ